MAYTKYSLTPANNTAAPPDGAPEGMLPSAVNDTMRDMMAQIRDAGDGIRNGTYTMTAPVITGGSITGVALSGNTLTNPVITGGSINNTPIGASTANTGAFTTLGATGVATFSAGTVSAPAITTTGDTNTGIFFPAADTIAFAEGGVESMRVDSSGNLGIGTASPVGRLHLQSTGNFVKQNFSSSSGAAADISAYRASNALNLYLSVNRDTTTGVFGDTGSTASIINLAGEPSNSYITFSTSATNNTAPTERMRITSAGNVGIGTTAPSGRLSLVTPSGTANVLTMTGSGTAGSFTQYANTAGSFYVGLDNSTGTSFGSAYSGNIYHGGAYPILLWTNGTERMRINSSGLVLIGKTTDNINNVGIQLSPVGAVAFTRSTASGFVGYWNIQGGSGGIQEFYFADVAKGSISVAAGGTTYATTSDYRLKENIAPMTGALNVVQQLKPVTYNWKADGSSGQGFIAHELQEVVPDCVTGEKDAVNEDGSIKAQGIDTSFLVATLTAAIQEQQTLIENLTTRLNALEGK